MGRQSGIGEGISEERSRSEQVLCRSIASVAMLRAFDRTESAIRELETLSLSSSRLQSHGFLEARRLGAGCLILGNLNRNHCLMNFVEKSFKNSGAQELKSSETLVGSPEGAGQTYPKYRGRSARSMSSVARARQARE